MCSLLNTCFPLYVHTITENDEIFCHREHWTVSLSIEPFWWACIATGFLVLPRNRTSYYFTYSVLQVEVDVNLSEASTGGSRIYYSFRLRSSHSTHSHVPVEEFLDEYPVGQGIRVHGRFMLRSRSVFLVIHKRNPSRMAIIFFMKHRVRMPEVFHSGELWDTVSRTVVEDGKKKNSMRS